MGISSFTQLDVWKRAHQAVLTVYSMTRTFPRDERFGLVQQMRKAATSIPANIAEGFGRRQARDKAHFYVISKGSLEELRYYLILARDLELMKESTQLGVLLDDAARMLNRLYAVTLESIRS